MDKAIPVVDLFAGPGGLGEGFSSFEAPGGAAGNVWPFRIALSVEKETFAHRTLRLRSYFRLLVRNGQPLDSYYAYVTGKSLFPFGPDTRKYWDQAGEEALQLEIGARGANATIHDRVRKIAATNRNWILIGGPPCQAYSIVGRSRNMGLDDYNPEKDKRHFLYTHYLELITNFRPAIFIMENVKGILSSQVSGRNIFSKILEDLRAPDNAGGDHGDSYFRIDLDLGSRVLRLGLSHAWSHRMCRLDPAETQGVALRHIA